MAERVDLHHFATVDDDVVIFPAVALVEPGLVAAPSRVLCAQSE
jgi:hypothetical protein